MKEYPLEYIKTEDEAVYFEVTGLNFTFDIPETNWVTEDKSFTICEDCECFMVPVEEEDEVSRHDVGDYIFIAKKDEKVLVLGLEYVDALDMEIAYSEIFKIAPRKH